MKMLKILASWTLSIIVLNKTLCFRDRWKE